MSRLTNTERGARIAWETAYAKNMQLALFPDDTPPDFWADIALAAADQLADCRTLRAAVSVGVR